MFVFSVLFPASNDFLNYLEDLQKYEKSDGFTNGLENGLDALKLSDASEHLIEAPTRGRNFAAKMFRTRS